MTNKEKFKEVFGVDGDYTACPILDCTDCPLNEYIPTGICERNWWDLEYKENKE